jgi:hypothetical protein
MFMYFCDASRPGFTAMQLTEWARQAREEDAPSGVPETLTQEALRPRTARCIGLGWLWKRVVSTHRSLAPVARTR